MISDNVFEITLEIGEAINRLEELQGAVSFEEYEEMVVFMAVLKVLEARDQKINQTNDLKVLARVALDAMVDYQTVWKNYPEAAQLALPQFYDQRSRFNGEMKIRQYCLIPEIKDLVKKYFSVKFRMSVL
jgi:hypothetical protein